MNGGIILNDITNTIKELFEESLELLMNMYGFKASYDL